MKFDDLKYKVLCFLGKHFWTESMGYARTPEYNFRRGFFEQCLDCEKLRVRR